MVAIALFGIAGLLMMIINLLTAEADEPKRMGTLLLVVGLLGAIAGLTYLVTDSTLFLFSGFLLLVIAWLTALIVHAPSFVRWGLLAAIIGAVYATLDNQGLLIVMLVLAITRLIYIFFTDPLHSIHAGAERDALERSAHYLNQVRRTIRR